MKHAYNIFNINENNPEISFRLFLSENSFYELIISSKNISLQEVDKNNNPITGSYISDYDIHKFNINREKITKIEKLKPLSLQVLKFEAKEIFKDSIIHRNEITEIYKETIEQRNSENIPDHNFNFDISKNFS